jgi:hypothetical protein
MHLWGVRAIDETEFALKTLVNDVVLLIRSQATRIMIFMTVDKSEQGRK